ncbi:helicase-related protein [Brevibacillus fulvus]
MRAYLLYVKEERGKAQSYITPCFEVDKLFWQQSDGGTLHILGSSTSLAIVFALREKINQHVRSRRLTPETLRQLRELAHASVKEASVLYGKEDGQQECGLPFQFTSEQAEREQAEAFAMTAEQIRAEAEDLRSRLQGRSLLWEELRYFLQQHAVVLEEVLPALQWLALANKLEWRPGICIGWRKGWWKHRLLLRCDRCGSSRVCKTECHTCGQACAFCTECLTMGRSKCCTPYICVPAQPSHRKATTAGEKLLRWDGRYTPWQAIAAERARRFVSADDNQAFLVWAVCGAGKTELLFPAMEQALSDGGQILLATPRKDVVLELLPRLKRVFPGCKVIAVHGSSAEKWEEGQIVIATTHQVLRYYRKFPLVIVDEVDAFPYHRNPMLHRAVERAVAEGGKRLYLSATPPAIMQRALVGSTNRKALVSATHVLLPQRYHGHPLPVPTIQKIPRLDGKLRNGDPLPLLRDPVALSLQQHRPIFVFVPYIEQVEVALAFLQRSIPDHARRMAGVYAADPERERKVQRFRRGEYGLLVTTTILERGVTIPFSDVVVVGADAPVFDEASLVQIAGRAGRSHDSPDGLVLFLCTRWTKAQRLALKQIRQMNRLARQMKEVDGYVD